MSHSEVKMEPLRKVLYVEDELAVQKIVAIALIDIGGFALKICSSGREALAAFAAFAPDLVLLDAMMPDLDGPTTLAEIRKLPQGGRVPIVFLTSKTNPADLAELRALGALEVLTKPFNPRLLADRLQQLWATHAQ